jgi:hypothetical protein
MGQLIQMKIDPLIISARNKNISQTPISSWKIEDQAKTLVVIFSEKLVLSIVRNISLTGFDMDGKAFDRITTPNFFGFYDWLRSKDRHDIFGMVYQPMGEPECILEVASHLSYCIVDKDGFVYIFFDNRRHAGVVIADQELAGMSLFMSKEGCYAMSFEMYLGEESLDAIRRIVANGGASRSD